MENFLEGIFACPVCHGKLKIELFSEAEVYNMNGCIHCAACDQEYKLEDGIFYFNVNTEEKRVKGDEVWDLEKFEERYKNVGCYTSAYEWGKLTGIPLAVMQFMYPKVKGRLLEWLSPESDAFILDVGCGVGYFLFEISQKHPDVKMFMIGMDVIPARIRLLNQRCKQEKTTNILSVVASAEHLPFADNMFDYITCTEVLEHIFSPDKAVSEMSRTLKEGKELLVSTPIEEACERWKKLTSPLRAVKRFLRGKHEKIERKRSFDFPLSALDIKNYLKNNNLEIKLFEYNVILPPEGYFKKLPEFLTTFVVQVCSCIEKNLKQLFKPLAMHAVIKSVKQTDTTKNRVGA